MCRKQVVRKVFAVCFIFAALAFVFAACGGDPDDTNAGSTGNNVSTPSGGSNSSGGSGGNNASNTGGGSSSSKSGGDIEYTPISGPPITLPTTDVTQLTANVWGDGNITTRYAVQWFKFTATAAAQYIHVKRGTLDFIYVQV